MLVDKRLSELVYEQVPLLRQIQVVKPDWHRRYNIGTGDLHHGGRDVNDAWHVTWFPSVP